MKALIAIQQELKAPKGQFNKFGNFRYRSAEDILEAVKPLLGKHGAVLTLTDEIVQFGTWVFVRSTAVFQADGEQKETVAFARHPEAKKGMDDSQITGSASSYARKYALSGLFLIDNEQDPDSMKPEQPEPPPMVQRPPVPGTVPGMPMPPMPPKR